MSDFGVGINENWKNWNLLANGFQMPIELEFKKKIAAPNIHIYNFSNIYKEPPTTFLIGGTEIKSGMKAGERTLFFLSIIWEGGMLDLLTTGWPNIHEMKYGKRYY